MTNDVNLPVEKHSALAAHSLLELESMGFVKCPLDQWHFGGFRMLVYGSRCELQNASNGTWFDGLEFEGPRALFLRYYRSKMDKYSALTGMEKMMEEQSIELLRFSVSKMNLK